MVEISSEEELRAWLEAWPQEVAVAIAARAALRATPILALARLDDETSQTLLLPSFRARVIGSVRMRSHSIAVSRAAGSATFAIHAARSSAADAADTDTLASAASAADTMLVSAATADATLTAASAALGSGAAARAAARAAADAARAAALAADAADAAAFWDDVSADATIVENGAGPVARFDQPLWHEAGMPAGLQVGWARLRTYLTETDPRMRFWAEWYQRMLDGDPMDWAMQEEIALLPDQDWDAGPDRIAERIAVIEAKYLSQATPLAETVEINPETGKARAVPAAPQAPELYRTALTRVADALDDALARGGNGLHDRSFVVRVVRRALKRYADDPQRVHDDFLTGAVALRRNLDAKEYPETDEVLSLEMTLGTAAADIRGADATVEASVKARLRVKLRDLRAEEKTRLLAAKDALVEASEGPLSEDLGEDIDVLVASRDAPSGEFAPPISIPDATYRLASRTSAWAELDKTVKIGERVLVAVAAVVTILAPFFL
ncbi:MAG: hypothetical protein AAFR46_14570 [Pseudomonadota bacterium]